MYLFCTSQASLPGFLFFTKLEMQKGVPPQNVEMVSDETNAKNGERLFGIRFSTYHKKRAPYTQDFFGSKHWRFR